MATGVTPGVYCAGDTFAPKITIDAVGRITFAECVELTGFVKNNNPTAYNNYVWPTGNGLSGQILVNDGAGNLTWSYGAFGKEPGLGLVVDGTILKLSIPIATTPPLVGPALNQAVQGSLYWDSICKDLFIYYDDGVSPQWYPATTYTSANFVRLNNNTAFNSYIWPNADGLPGTFLTTNGGGTLNWTAGGLPAGLGLAVDNGFTKVSILASSSPPPIGTNSGEAMVGSMYFDTDLAKLFYLYDDGTTVQWVQL